MQQKEGFLISRSLEYIWKVFSEVFRYKLRNILIEKFMFFVAEESGTGSIDFHYLSVGDFLHAGQDDVGAWIGPVPDQNTILELELSSEVLVYIMLHEIVVLKTF